MPSGTMKNIFCRLLCLMRFHAFHVVEVTLGFGPSGAVEKVHYPAAARDVKGGLHLFDRDFPGAPEVKILGVAGG